MEKYSCCYVLVDNDELKYYNQMMISLSSLRYTGFTGKVYIIVDRATEMVLSQKRDELDELSAEMVTVDTEGNYSQKEKSRFLKTSVRSYISGDALYVDTDTIFVTHLPDHITDDELAMVYDGNGFNDKVSYNWHKEKFDRCDFNLQEGDSYFFNAGVIWMRDTPVVHKAFDNWHSIWKENMISGVFNDQIYLNYLWKKQNIEIQELDDIYNVQIGQDYFSPSLFFPIIVM